jgi:hypothetical protein
LATIQPGYLRYARVRCIRTDARTVRKMIPTGMCLCFENTKLTLKPVTLPDRSLDQIPTDISPMIDVLRDSRAKQSRLWDR